MYGGYCSDLLGHSTVGVQWYSVVMLRHHYETYGMILFSVRCSFF